MISQCMPQVTRSLVRINCAAALADWCIAIFKALILTVGFVVEVSRKLPQRLLNDSVECLVGERATLSRAGAVKGRFVGDDAVLTLSFRTLYRHRLPN